jgi:hypothetical protein
MDWTDEPATENQLTYLRQSGYTPEHPLTKAEAVELIQNLRRRPGVVPELSADASRHDSALHAFELRRNLEQARQRLAEQNSLQHQAGVSAAMQARQEFWIDTCLEPSHMKAASTATIGLYREFGCRFERPTHEQTQEILDALDTALPVWDRDHPELFYQTLELNFRELLRTY